uniref:Hemagglutinin-neuraminidase n=1 Tax=Avian paramyxovirus 1 TaxID=2560319 RepID=A0A482ERB7_NCDV|nr:hemaglutinin-neuraminidase protein [avian paramyxovirus 1]QBM78886.1 hemaglutinin-neuraminidase protein [avian paramyxovirus 1]QBM78891.1 hemaglutinin-neuraminidase protein [avian paramyxovirus 1]QBM78896.1 hemaglutinin-neuraminidase protein [avian paramyxovirus 1]QBM78901.1 hemaglutinin-neuraminidase protein [avian paramyxovirus 1]
MDRVVNRIVLENEEREAKNTWRLVFRVAVLSLIVMTLAISVVALVYSMEASTPNDLAGISAVVSRAEDRVTSLLKSNQDVVDRVYKQVALESPLALLNTESIIMNAITSLSYQINGAANNSGCGAPVHDPDYIGGVGKELIVDDTSDATSFYPSAYQEHLNFIPAPTTGSGCTRIPSFDMSATHYCYTHNVILSGCRDHSHSHQYLALGVLRTSATGRVFFSTLRSINLDDTQNRKSCSVSATPLGCDMLCSKVTETEEEDYKSVTPTSMVHGRLGFDGQYHEKDLDVIVLFKDWVANYPGVGGGSLIDDRVWFPVYGGLKPNSPSDTAQEGKYVIYKRYNNTCPDEQDYQVRMAKSSYKPGRFGGRRVQQAILSIKVSTSLGEDPVLTIPPNTVTLMGAEGRILTVGTSHFLYQRGSSYFSPALLYPMTVLNKTATLHSPYTFNAFTRPGSVPCQASARCPNSCITGVYTDPYPVVFHRNHTLRGVFGTMLDNEQARLNPVSAIFDYTSRSRITRVSSTSTKAAYTTSTCFKVVKTNKVYCLSIAEISNTLFGEFRIVPLLVEILKDDRV